MNLNAHDPVYGGDAAKGAVDAEEVASVPDRVKVEAVYEGRLADADPQRLGFDGTACGEQSNCLDLLLLFIRKFFTPGGAYQVDLVVGEIVNVDLFAELEWEEAEEAQRRWLRGLIHDFGGFKRWIHGSQKVIIRLRRWICA